MGETVTMGRHRCAGCERGLGPAKPWCAPCGQRLPADLANRVAHTARQHQSVVDEASMWLRRHPAASERDMEILTLVAQGMGNADIATKLDIGVETVRDHLRRLSSRWGCKGRAHLIGSAYQLGYLKVRHPGETP